MSDMVKTILIRWKIPLLIIVGYSVCVVVLRYKPEWGDIGMDLAGALGGYYGLKAGYNLVRKKDRKRKEEEGDVR